VYQLTTRARLVALEPELPQADTGAPAPAVAASEDDVLLAYAVGGGDDVAVVRFTGSLASMLGPPNAEAVTGHPLAPAGLGPYAFAEVLDSPWIARLEEMNRVHPRHAHTPFATLRHIILSFHDTTFECLARSIELLGLDPGEAPTTALAARLGAA
jgi:hypothetical protein